MFSEQLTKKHYFWLIVSLIVFADVTSQCCIKKYTTSKILLYLIIGMIGYSIYGYLLSHIFTLTKFSTIYALISQIGIILVAFIGYFIFKEKITNKEMLGLILSIISIFLLV